MSVQDVTAPPHAAVQAGHRPLVAALCIFGAVSLLGILIRPTLPIDETRYLAVAWEMRLGHDWLVPHLNGHAYSDKPPMLFWLINLVWLFTGPSGFAARLVAPVFGLVTIALTARLGARLHPQRPEYGGWAALILSGSLGFALYGGLTMFDTMLSAATAAGVLALTHVERRGLRPWLVLGAALAFGALAKGPVILIHLLPIAVAAAWWKGIGLRAMAQGLGAAICLALAIVGLWLVPALTVGSPEYREAILWTQSAGRMVQSFAHGRPVWFFLAVLPLLLWPWAWSPRIWRQARFTPPLVVWSVATLLIFSLISGKQAHYLIPVLPAFAIAFAPALAGSKRRAPIACLLPFGLALAMCALIVGLAPQEYITAANPHPVALLVVALLAAAAAVALIDGVTVFLAAPLVVCASACIFLGEMGESHDAAPLARRLAPHDTQGIGLIDGKYHGQFTFAGRLHHPVIVFGDAGSALDWLQECAGRVLTAPLKNGPGQPADTIDFRGQPWGIWLPQTQSDRGQPCRN
ncbi:ArnT family glycosyltransferase [Paracoccus laeviglucosivorans]|uniref:4-amino-4-deoxy-L-arabinose transferase n=1 Tax=Paracoccus laeviglucosivorans TaxID=1197861 RepID=A0A521F2D3_9RHOB|nr:glycosyltransferase family 39 protein [Paracoccus laeviglucosivorans]SMO90333.1 4-amino-4-deoxy-L-arabinose transferase [Paracoccus laeviglucosivorans]